MGLILRVSFFFTSSSQPMEGSDLPNLLCTACCLKCIHTFLFRLAFSVYYINRLVMFWHERFIAYVPCLSVNISWLDVSTKAMKKRIKLHTLMQEVTGLNISRDTSYPNWCFPLSSSQSLLKMSQIGSLPLLCKSFTDRPNITRDTDDAIKPLKTKRICFM
jgi:hypothetical protein